MKCSTRAVALAAALWCGILAFVSTWWVIAFDGTGGEMPVFSQIYRGYTITPLGSIVGFIWGFVDGLICGALFGWLYNTCAGTPQATP